MCWVQSSFGSDWGVGYYSENFLDFMQFFGNFDKIVCWHPLEGWRPLLQGILDPPLLWCSILPISEIRRPFVKQISVNTVHWAMFNFFTFQWLIQDFPSDSSDPIREVLTKSVADPGFPRRGGATIKPLCLARKPVIWQDFCRKLHENERNGTEWRP